MDTGITACEGDVGVTKDGEGHIAVVEASGEVAELCSIVTGVAVGEPCDVCTAVVVI